MNQLRLPQSVLLMFAFQCASPWGSALGDEPPPRAVFVIDRDTTLDPARTYGAIRITASDITIDGHGARIVGTVDGDAAKYQGTGISADGVSRVTIKNVRVLGWERGLHVIDGQEWTVQDCDFSENFHDPAFGWGENGRRGGILFERVQRSTIRDCRAQRVWDACVLVDSDGNTIEQNDFSHTSNTCLKLWHASRNTIRGNRLCYGIRKDPGEVHARDSTCVLIESGSNHNCFLRNDCRYGGDGIFIRVLNGWVSTNNYFEENDCSYANNNCIEAWSPSNTWVRNKANHGSYGFWLGASDKNILIANEASFNGLPSGNHQSPHLPDHGHAGIVFMFGPSSHTVLQGNRCEGNHGAGIAAIGDQGSAGEKWNAFHWIVQQNRLIGNRWGIYLEYAEMLHLAANHFEGNELEDVHVGRGVQHLMQRPSTADDPQSPPQAALRGPAVVRVGETAEWDASASIAEQGMIQGFTWRMQPDRWNGPRSGPTASLKFDEPGFYRLGLTVNNGHLAGMAWREIYVISSFTEHGSEPDAVAGWRQVDGPSTVRVQADRQHKLVGEASIHAVVQPYDGGRVWLEYRPEEPIPLAGKTHLCFWLKFRNEHVPAWQDKNPLVSIVSPSGDARTYEPDSDRLSNLPYNEAREGWLHLAIPLDGDATWQATGQPLDKVTTLRLGFDSWGAPPLHLWIDGITWEDR